MAIKMRRDTTANWASVNPTLASGEIGYDTTLKQFKMGDGATAWASLPVVGGHAETALTDAATIDWDLAAAPVAKVTLAGNRTLAAPTNMKAGARYLLRITQDATGNRTLALNAVYKTGTSPVLQTAAAANDIIEFHSDGTSMFILNHKGYL